MTIRKLVAEIDRDMYCDPDKGWIHQQIGAVAGLDDQRRLTSFLYRYYYQGLRDSNHHPPALGTAARSIESLEDTALANQFAAALPSPFYNCPGWRLVTRNNDAVIVERQGVQLSVANHEWHQDIACEQAVFVRMPTGRRYASPGFFTGFSACGKPDKTDGQDRFYVNIDEEAAVPVFQCILQWAGENHLPATVKVINSPNRYARRDPLIAYFSRTSIQDLQKSLVNEILSLDLPLRKSVPAFTCKIRQGISWAQDPASDGLGTGLGFGMHRCSVIARGLERSRLAGTDQFEHLLVDEWVSTGLDLDKPHLSPVK